MATEPTLPGRLGDPSLTLGTDPRSDPRMVAAMQPLELDGPPVDAGVDVDTPIETLLEYCREAEPGFEMMNDVMFAAATPVEGVSARTEVIRGDDGNDVTLYIHEPADRSGPIPGILHLHGGGMTILEAAGKGYVHWRNTLAATGLVVVGVEFRNAGGKLGDHPFPAGLDDCFSSLKWMAANRDALGVSNIVISGESGGGNLSLATTLRAKRESMLDEVSGVYALCPYISNAYATKDPALPSLWENDEYFLACKMMGALAKVYDPDGENATNPLAWPYHASADDLAGLPPHLISVNQLDPLRDEGLAYYRKLLAAGVPAISRTVNGTCHAGDVLFAAAMPEVYAATARDIHGFATSL